MNNKLWKAFLGLTGVGVVALTLGMLSAQAAYVPYPVSSGGNKYKIESATIGTTGTIVRSSSAWVTAGTWSPTGRITIPVVAGAFSGTMMCVCTPINGNYSCNQGNSTAITTSNLIWEVATNAASPTNQQFDIICFGPR